MIKNTFKHLFISIRNINIVKNEYTLIDVDKINMSNVDTLPDDFIKFCNQNNLKYPPIHTNKGKVLCAMVNNKWNYWNRKTCDEFVKKFNIKTDDSIQLFNKHSQWGIKTSEEKGKNYIIYPYTLSNKHKMRKDFKYSGTDLNENIEIIKSTIKADYIDVTNDKWQLGHKNPESIDNTSNNLIIQPPIQSKYRDRYIFIDTLTKIPTPKTLIQLYNYNNCPYTNDQLKTLKNWLNTLNL